MVPITEINRIVRHAVAPLVILAVERGWIPAAAEHDIIELTTIIVAIGAMYGVSWWRDKQKDRKHGS